MNTSSSSLSVACALCGADCEAEARFCPHCGSPISTASKGDDALVGERIGGWHLTERIGADALLRLFRAEREEGKEPVTLGIFHDHLSRNRSFMQGIAQAAKEAQQLSHPGILRVLGSGVAEVQGRRFPFLSLESFEGRNLCAIVQARGLLPIPQVHQVAIELLEALGAAHRRGIVHGDLMPENIILGATEDGEIRAKITSFALGRLASTAAPRVMCGGTASGTVLFRAPEVIDGQEPSVRSDLYSLGAILYEQLTGSPPFVATSCLALERQHTQRAPEPPRDAAPWRGISQAVQSVILRALEKDPTHRFGSAPDMLRAFKEAKNAQADEQAEDKTDPQVRHSARRPLRLVGRAELLDALYTTALVPMAYGKEDRGFPRGAVALLLGGAGMGKSALLRDLLARLDGGPLAVVRVDGRRSITRPLEPFTSLARDALGLRRGASGQDVEYVEQSLQTRYRLHHDEIVRLLDRVTGRPSSLSLTPDVIEREQVRSLRSFLGRMLAMRPTLLVIEDADAMDAASLQLTRDLMAAAATLALSVIVSTRGDLWADWDAGYVTRLHVRSLEPPHARKMLDRRLVGSEVSAAARDLAVTWSKGSPLLLDLCSRAMARHELLVGRDGKLDAPSTSQDLFGGLRHVVSLSLRGASPSVRRWLICASVFGSSSPIDMLESFESPRPNRDAVLAGCRDSGIVHPVDDVLVFGNEGVREVVRAAVAEGEERQVHAFIATWLREVDPHRAALEVVAQHVLGAGDEVSAAEIFEIDALDLLRRDAPLAASNVLGRSLRIWRDLADDAGIRRVGLARAEALLAAGDGKAATELLADLESSGPLAADGLRARIFSNVALTQGSPELALRALMKASRTAVDTLDQDAWFDIEIALAEALYRQGRTEEAQAHATTALDLSISIAESQREQEALIAGARIAQAATFVSKLRIELGRIDDARDALTNSLGRTAGLGDQASASRVLANLAHAHAETGDTEGALDYARRAFDLAHRAGDRMAASRVAINLGAYLAKLEKKEEALETFAHAKALARAVGWARGVRLSKSAMAQVRAGGM